MQNLTQFSQKYLDLKNFCCTSNNQDIIRWVGCKPGVYNGSKTLFSSEEISMCSWFQAINSYAYSSIDIDPEEIFEVNFNEANFILIKITWPSEALESEKLIEIGLNKQPGYVGSTIPFYIGIPNPPDYNYTIVKDVMIVNGISSFSGPIKINNISKHKATVSLLYAY